MTPTNKLRFVERFKMLYEDPETGSKNGLTIKILQQWWETDSFDMITGQTAGEWRDVPVEKEQA